MISNQMNTSSSFFNDDQSSDWYSNIILENEHYAQNFDYSPKNNKNYLISSNGFNSDFYFEKKDEKLEKFEFEIKNPSEFRQDYLYDNQKINLLLNNNKKDLFLISKKRTRNGTEEISTNFSQSLQNSTESSHSKKRIFESFNISSSKSETNPEISSIINPIENLKDIINKIYDKFYTDNDFTGGFLEVTDRMKFNDAIHKKINTWIRKFINCFIKYSLDDIKFNDQELNKLRNDFELVDLSKKVSIKILQDLHKKRFEEIMRVKYINKKNLRIKKKTDKKERIQIVEKNQQKILKEIYETSIFQSIKGITIDQLYKALYNSKILNFELNNIEKMYRNDEYLAKVKKISEERKNTSKMKCNQKRKIEDTS